MVTVRPVEKINNMNGGKNIKETILGFLNNHHTMSLATSRDDCPFAASLFYANDGFIIYFLSSPVSQHSLNLSQNPNVAITINKDYSEWRMIKGLQIIGKADKVPEEELPIVIKTYSEKHSFVRLILWDRNFSSRIVDVGFFKVIPETVRLIDNEVGFGYKVEIHITEKP